MSTVIEQLKEAQATLAALTTERDNLKASLDATTKQRDEAERMMRAMEDVAAKHVAKVDLEIQGISAKLEAESDAKSAAEKAKAESDAELAKLKAAVSGNPAFADAAAKGAKPVADVGKQSPKATREEYSKMSSQQKAEFTQNRGRLS